MAMSDITRDVLCGCPLNDGVEVEFRFPIQPLLFDTINNQWAEYMGAAVPAPVVSELLYSNTDDLRCIDGQWQRKRAIVHQRLPCAVRSTLAISIESAAAAPLHYQHVCVRRTRWTYATQNWQIDFTQSTRACNVELEFTGSVTQLVESARNSGDMYGVWMLLSAIVSRISFKVVAEPTRCMPGTAAMPFVRLETWCRILSSQKRQHLVTVMQRNQPVSMSSNATALECPLVSMKYDGVRVALNILRCKNKWVAIAVCRRSMLWWVPCLTARCEMVLDCEYMKASHTFVVFDVLSVGDRFLRSTYSQRLLELARLPLPVLSGYTVTAKVMYPLCVLTAEWYHDRKSNSSWATDGIILHDGAATLDRASPMYKWKEQHTVDLVSGRDNLLFDGKYMPFLKPEPGSGVRAKGEVWECSIVDNKYVRPLRVRTDKPRANAGHVCRDILRAHREKLSIDDVVRVLTRGGSTVRKSKRKRAL